jgi:predicted homoserine dehydrogenase-like protein
VHRLISGRQIRHYLNVMAESLNFETDSEIRCREFKIGCIGAGFIMADVQLSAYAMAGFPVVAIASRRAEKASEVANRWKIPTVLKHRAN